MKPKPFKGLPKSLPLARLTHVYSVMSPRGEVKFFGNFQSAAAHAMQIRRSGGIPETKYIPAQQAKGEIS